MGNLKAFSIWFCLVIVLCGVGARPDGSDLESAKNNGNDEGEQWTNDNNDNNGGYDESDSQNHKQNEQDDQNSHANSYNKNSGYRKQTLAKVIRQSQGPQTLDEIYSGKNLNADIKYASGDRSNKQKLDDQQVLFYLKFPRDFDQIDPRDPNSSFTWRRNAIFTGEASTIDAPLADNGVFKLVDAKYGAPGYLQMTSVPFVFAFLYQEASLGFKQDLTVGRNERILGRMKLACHIIGADRTPYNRTEVSDPTDDLRLGQCRFQMANTNNTFRLVFSVEITNKSVWALYITPTFLARRKVGVRERYDSIVDAGIELDKRQNVVNYYLNGYKVWTINSIGAPPPDDGITQIDSGRIGTPTLVNITAVAISFGTAKALDQSDPNSSDPTRLARVQAFNSTRYSPSASFYYPNPTRINFLWGQGAVLKAYKLLIVKTNSTQLRQSTALAAENGSSTNTNSNDR